MLLLVRVMVVLLLVAPLCCRRAQMVLSKGSRGGGGSRGTGGTGRGIGGGGKGWMVQLMLKPTVQISSSYNSVHSSSLSPWNYTEQCDDARLPRCISHARCLTRGCIDPQSGSEDLLVEAKPIYYQLMVLYRVPPLRLRPRKKKKSRRGYDFKLSSERVSVGCTCVKPTILHLK